MYLSYRTSQPRRKTTMPVFQISETAKCRKPRGSAQTDLVAGIPVQTWRTVPRRHKLVRRLIIQSGLNLLPREPSTFSLLHNHHHHHQRRRALLAKYQGQPGIIRVWGEWGVDFVQDENDWSRPTSLLCPSVYYGTPPCTPPSTTFLPPCCKIADLPGSRRVKSLPSLESTRLN